MPLRITGRELEFRKLKLRKASLDDKERSVELDIATETPVREFDWKRGEYIDRVLLSSGAQFPKTRQIPLLDSHSRYSVQSQLGSIRGLIRHAGDGRVSGRAVFSSVAENEFTKVREGHVTDVSAGFHVLKEEYIPEGASRTIDGKTFAGPVNVATKWRLYEGSILPIGADEMAKMRGLDPSVLHKQQEEKIIVNPELRKLCVERGMDSKLDDKAAMEWLNANYARVMAPPPAPTPVPPAPAPAPTPAPAATREIDPAAISKSVSDQVFAEMDRREQLRVQQQKEQREAFEKDVDSTLKMLFGETIEPQQRAACLALGTIDSVRTYLGEQRRKQEELTRSYGNFITPVGNQRDAHREVLKSAFLVRAFDNASNGASARLLPLDKRVKGWEQFTSMRLVDLARECLMADGYSWNELRGFYPEQLAKAALGWPEKFGLRGLGMAYHTTGSLAIITQDAINKTLLMGYNEAPSTWRTVFRQASSANDFKQIHRIKLSALGNLPVWNDNTDPKKAALANEEEKYAVEARALCVDFSWQLIVNDDMNALSRAPALLGASAARTVNAVVWAQLTSNPAMSDGQTLFLANATGNRKRSNLTTGAATPTNATLAAMKNKMRLMRGLNTPEGNESADILNLSPSFILGPSALEEIILKQVLSGSDPANANSTAYNTARTYTPVIEPLLDAASATAWYLAASTALIDTIEATFLAGQETPVTNDYVNEKTWSREVTVVQTFAAKAIDHRGLQKHDGV